MKYLLLILLCACVTEVVETPPVDLDADTEPRSEEVQVDVSAQGLYGLPSEWCETPTHTCVTHKISTLNVGRGSDLPSANQSKCALAGALYFRLRGNGDFWWVNDQPAGYAMAVDQNDGTKAKLGGSAWAVDGRKFAPITIASIIKFNVAYNLGSYAYEYDLCPPGRLDPSVEFFGRLSSADDVRVCWGGK